MFLERSVLAVVETLYECLDRSPVAIVLLDSQKRIVFANDCAAELAARADGITLCTSGIGLLRGADNSRLQGLIAHAVSHEPATLGHRSPGEGCRSMCAPRASGRRPYGISVVRLRTCERDRSPRALRPAVCVVIADPESRRVLSVERLQDAFELTEAEARLAARLAGGQGLRPAAHSLGITYGTARARLAEIFQKTDTRRQGELVNLLLTTLA